MWAWGARTNLAHWMALHNVKIGKEEGINMSVVCP